MGHKSLCSKNLLPDSSLLRPQKFFDSVIYTGNGSTGQSITSLDFQPDFIWFKSRSHARNNSFSDSVRGRAKVMFPDVTNAEDTDGDTQGVISYNPFQFLNVGYQGLDGFSTFRSYPNGFAAVLTVMCGAVEIVTLHREDAANVAGYMDLDLETLPSAIVTSTYETDKEQREEMMRKYRAVTPTLSMIRRVSKRVFRVGETLVMPSGTFFAYRYVMFERDVRA